VIRITSVNGNPDLQPLVQHNLRVIALLGKIVDQTAKIPGLKVQARATAYTRLK